LKKPGIAIILLILCMVFFISGCIEIDIEAGIDAGFNAFLSYNIVMDVDHLDRSYQNTLRNTFHRIALHYQDEEDFVIEELLLEASPLVLRMFKRETNNSFEQAYRSLESLITNEDITPFTMVDMDFQNHERQSIYVLDAAVDISQIIRLSNAQELPSVLQDQMELGMTNGEGTVTISLPASELISSSHRVDINNNRASMTVPISYTDQTELKITGVVNLLRDGLTGGSLTDIIWEQNRLRTLSIVITSAAVVVILIIMLVVLLNRKKHQ